MADMYEPMVSNPELVNSMVKSSKPNFWSNLGNFASKALGFISNNLNPLSFIGNAVGNLFNYGHELANYNYEKKLQQEIFNREDTAFSRALKDYESAGFSPLAVFNQKNGYNAGGVVSTNAPHLQNDMLARVGVVNSLNMQKEQIKQMKKDSQLKDVEIASKKLDNLIKQDKYETYDKPYFSYRNEYQKNLPNLMQTRQQLQEVMLRIEKGKADKYDEDRFNKLVIQYLNAFSRYR